jgi:predicted nucleic acid-binding protein
MPATFEVHIPHVSLLLPGTLGLGEREAIGLAIQTGCDAMAIDDRPARRAAVAHGLPVIGTFGLLLKAKHQGLIGEVASIMTAMVEAGQYASHELQMAVLEDAGEL